MNAEFFDAIDLIEKEKGIPREYMIEKITQALITAFRRDNGGNTDNVVVDVNEEKKEILMYVKKEVVTELNDPSQQILLEQAREISPNVEPGDIINVEVKTQKFGRIAAQTAKQVIIQGIREAKRGMVFDEFTSKEHEILTGTVVRTDPRNGNVVIELGGRMEHTEAVLTLGEQVRDEAFRDNERIKVYLVEVRKTTKDPQIIISRTHPGLVTRLFELEVPEIHDGVIEIKSIAREAGSRTKISVWSRDPNVDPIGACIGPRGARVGNIVDELRGEKIDIIKYSNDDSEYVAAALSPADVISVEELPGGKSFRVVVPDDQLSLAIGKEGQNVRLAAKLTGFKIDIHPESSAYSL